MFESSILRRILGPKRCEVTGEWRKLNNEDHYNLYSSNIIWVIKKNEMGGECSKNGGKERCIQGFGGET